MTFAAAERIADAVLYEGYVLYPYRASAAKNQFRWQFGVVAPRAARDDAEPSFSQTECLIDPADPAPRLSVRVRFLRPRRAAANGAATNGSASLSGERARAWLEGVPVAIDAIDAMNVGVPVEQVLRLADTDVDARLVVCVRRTDPFIHLQLRLENHEAWRPEFESDRDAMLERSLVGAHLLIGVDGGSFVSLLEPSDRAAVAVAACRNHYTWPVLVGDRTQRTLMLSSPIVLYDYPAVANESPGDLCDAAEIDEILSLRILTMTDDEKRQARATDPRARAILDRVEAQGPETLAALHGTMRSADFFNPAGTPPPDQAFVVVNGRRVARGTPVRLRPKRRADAMDMFLKDQAATVAGVYCDVDERIYVAVTVDADPAAALHESFGRFFYFDPTEIEPIDRPQERV